MPVRSNLPHLLLPIPGVAEPFQTKGAGGKSLAPTHVPDRESHARMLLAQLEPIVAAAAEAARRDDLPKDEVGVYVEVVGRAGEPLIADSLERGDIELLAVRRRGDTTLATLFVPSGSKDKLGKAVESYRTKIDSRSMAGDPIYRKLVEGIAEIRLAFLRELWADDPDEFPSAGLEALWETWLRPKAEARFRAFAERQGIEIGATGLSFPETSVVRVKATPEAMAVLVGTSLAAAELRRTSTTAEFFDSLPPGDQFAFSDELGKRLAFRSPTEAPVRVCLLDTGVNRGHPLIAPACEPGDCYSVVDSSIGDDHHGHGTTLAGIALFGDLVPVLDSRAAIDIPHRLESVKIIPPAGANPHDLLGAITRDAVELIEMLGLGERRIFCLATTTEDDTPHYGLPTSWSAEIDQLAAGVGKRMGERRLLCVSAGNLRDGGPSVDDYPERNDAAEIEAPAQAWNALTVGAFTRKVVMTRRDLAGHTPFAAAGDLSPNSRTASWDDSWPVKPDIVLEGGNLAVDPATRRGWTTADLGILTTSRDFPNPVFTVSGDTSAATAEASRLAALISDAYPDLWPETVRALLAASANWTDAMRGYLPRTPKKGDYVTLLRRFGHGVPDLERARRSASNLLTLIAQDELQPYKWSEKSKGPILNEMKLFSLPWPRTALEALQAAEVRMRVALSYFVEPNPSETQRNRKLRYASHGLRFRLNLPGEDELAFRKRINKAALADGERVGGVSDSAGWTIGSDHREVGSLHCDTWTGFASDLARRNLLAVFPVGGWWKERPHLDRWASQARFSLVVTIDAGQNDVDIYTPVVTAIENLVKV